MPELVHVPQHLIAKSGEEITPAFMAWIQMNKRRLSKVFPAGERNFCRIIDKMKSRLPKRWATRLHYTRQKHFLVAPHVVFFGDFYFGNLRLLVELDGSHHSAPAAAEKDEWRSRLISAWRARTIRLTNDRVSGSDFREVEAWFIDEVVKNVPRQVGAKLDHDYYKMRRELPHIYQVEGIPPYSLRLTP
jgi:very-short-patch-repair endonuclease